jgi:membrane protease YdiL (CAAX protease family)
MVLILTLTVAMLLIFSWTKGHTSIISDYIPSLITMALITLYLIKVVGVKHITYHKGINTVYVVVIGVIAAVAYLKLTGMVMSIPHSRIINAMNKSSYIGLLLVIVILGPILEEVLFRGYIYDKARYNIGNKSAWVLNIFLSTFAHYFGSSFGAPIITIAYWFGAIIIITIAYQYGGLYSSFIVHGFMNMHWAYTQI